MIKVTLSPNGDVTFETDTTDEAVSIAKKWQAPKKPPVKKKQPAEPQLEASLTRAQMETWEWFLSRPAHTGSLAEYSLQHTYPPSKSKSRFASLQRVGLLQRIGYGLYQAGGVEPS
jgi:hypothetical protein